MVTQRLIKRTQTFQTFKIVKGIKICDKLPLSWKKEINSGVIIANKVRFRKEYEEKSRCSGCDEKVSQMEKFESNLRKLQRQPAKSMGRMLP